MTAAAGATTSALEKFRLSASKLLPHDTLKTTSPPAPLVSGEGPTIIVASLMRSGTHLVLDSLFNNFPQLRRSPLFVDFDAYERAALPVEPLGRLQGVVIKTHYPETLLAPDYASALSTLASKAVVLMPRRTTDEVRRSLQKWGMDFSPAEFAEVEESFRRFWATFSPYTIQFRSLLRAENLKATLDNVANLTGLEWKGKVPVMPATSRVGIYLDKFLTRLSGCRAPRINTTIGYRLAPKQPS